MCDANKTTRKVSRGRRGAQNAVKIRIARDDVGRENGEERSGGEGIWESHIIHRHIQLARGERTWRVRVGEEGCVSHVAAQPGRTSAARSTGAVKEITQNTR
jgi:hypothetical protein